jgi:hypothetical protein
MKINLIIAIVIFAFSSLYSQNSVETVLRKYKNDEGVISLNFKGDLSKFLKTQEKIKLKSSIDACEVLVFSAKEDINKADKTKLKTALSKDNYEMLVNVKDKKGKMELHAISHGDVLGKIFANVNYDNRNFYFLFTGKIHFDELSKMNFDFEGGEAFKNFLD